MTQAEPIDHEPWPLRALLLLALGALFGLLFHELTRGAQAWVWSDNHWRMAAATFLAVGGIVFAFSLERLRWAWSAGFAAAGGLIVALVAWWNGAPQEWGQGEGWQFFASLLAVAIAVPLFQAGRDAGGRRFADEAVHAHVWTNLILGFAACAFVGATMLLLLLLSELFHLIGLDQLRRLIAKGWFMWPLGCGAFGAAVGLLRDRDNVLGTLQKVVRAVLSVLAPVLALGLLVFVLALPFTGLEPLWSQTKATTPILLVCILGAVVLVNAVIGNAGDEEARSPMLRWPALALATVILPLALVAAVSTGKRIGQYGFTPDRLWAAVFVAVAAAVALAYLFALVRGRRDWPTWMRRSNVRLAAGICLLALFLALPIVSFGAISARDQLARLESGRIAPDRFDWAAMRFDFGPSGRRALDRLVRSPNATIREHARAVLAAKSRYDGRDIESNVEPPREIRIFPAGAAMPPGLREALLGRFAAPGVCRGKGECLLFLKPGEASAVVLVDRCAGMSEEQARRDARCELDPATFELTAKGWQDVRSRTRLELDRRIGRTAAEDEAARLGREREAARNGEVEIRQVTRRQVFLGGRPKGGVFE